KPREAMMTSRASRWYRSGQNSENASRFIFRSGVKLPRVPIGGGQNGRCRAVLVGRRAMSIALDDARAEPTRAAAHRASGRLRDGPHEAGEPEGGEKRDHHARGAPRGLLRDPAEVRDVPRADLVAERSRDHEERRRHEAVGEHLEDRPREAEDRPAAIPTPGA